MSANQNKLSSPVYDFGPDSHRRFVPIRVHSLVVNRSSNVLESPVYDFSRGAQQQQPKASGQSTELQHTYVANRLNQPQKVCEITVNGITRDVVAVPVQKNASQYFGVVRGGRFNSN